MSPDNEEDARDHSLLLYGVTVLALTLLFLRQELIALSAPALVAQALSVALMVWSRLTLGLRSFHAAATPTSGPLVATGPYRVWRHPIYASIIYFAWSGILSAPSPTGIALGSVIAISLYARMLTEERRLETVYPDYAQYACGTARLIPGIL